MSAAAGRRFHDSTTGGLTGPTRLEAAGQTPGHIHEGGGVRASTERKWTPPSSKLAGEELDSGVGSSWGRQRELISPRFVAATMVEQFSRAEFYRYPKKIDGRMFLRDLFVTNFYPNTVY